MWESFLIHPVEHLSVRILSHSPCWASKCENPFSFILSSVEVFHKRGVESLTNVFMFWRNITLCSCFTLPLKNTIVKRPFLSKVKTILSLLSLLLYIYKYFCTERWMLIHLLLWWAMVIMFGVFIRYFDGKNKSRWKHNYSIQLYTWWKI